MDNYILRNILSADNELRRQAEAQLLSDRETNPAALLQILTEGMKDADFSIAQLSAITYKKLFLDDPRSEQLTVQDLESPYTILKYRFHKKINARVTIHKTLIDKVLCPVRGDLQMKSQEEI